MRLPKGERGVLDMKTKFLILFAVWGAFAWGLGAIARGQTLPDDIDSMPDGVSIQAFDGGGFRVISIASAPYNSSAPAAVAAARTVAFAKAKAALARFLDEAVSVDEFVERERVRVRTADGENTSSTKVDVRRTLVRIKTESRALLRGVSVIGTKYVPAVGGGGILRLVAAVG